MLVFRAVTHQILGGIANWEDPDQTACTEQTVWSGCILFVYKCLSDSPLQVREMF